MDENQTNTIFVSGNTTPAVIEPAKPAVTKEPAEPKVDHVGYAAPVERPVSAAPKVERIDHVAEIAVLANSLTTASPSGAESIRDQILQRCADIKDPKAYDARMAAQKKAHDEAEAASKKIREADKAKAKAA